jgi:hypothetical protein
MLFRVFIPLAMILKDFSLDITTKEDLSNNALYPRLSILPIDKILILKPYLYWTSWISFISFVERKTSAIFWLVI